MSQTLTQIIHDMILDGARPAKIVAEELGKPYTTLLREINPYDGGAKLGADMLLPLMRVTGSIAPLQYLAHQMGYMLVPMKKTESQEGEPVPMALRLMEEIGEFSRLLQKAIQQDCLNENEFSRVEKAGMRTANATVGLVESLRSLSPYRSAPGKSSVTKTETAKPQESGVH